MGVEAIIQFVELNDGGWVMDFGCAEGAHVREFREREYVCWGVRRLGPRPVSCLA